jgi:hypothetical protein
VNSGLPGSVINTLVFDGKSLLAGTEGAGVFLSNNGGTTWTAINTGLTDSTDNAMVNSIIVVGTHLFAGTRGGVFLSTNGGTTWTAMNNGLTNRIVYALALTGANLFAGTYGGGVFLSTNSGTTWTAVNNGLTNAKVYALALSGTKLFAGTGDGGVFLSTDGGTAWTPVNNGLTNRSVYALALNGTNLFAGTLGGGVFLSANNGTSWTAVNTGLTNTTIGSFAVSGTSLFAGTDGDGVFLSTNGGTTWGAVNIGLVNASVWSLTVGTPGGGTGSENLFAGICGVWRRPLSEMITFVHRSSSELPGEFRLRQNYPNPFNPTTKIGFSIPISTFTLLRVYDLLGRKVATLVSEVLTSGSYEVTLDGTALASGAYLYRLHAGEFVQAKKLVLQK